MEQKDIILTAYEKPESLYQWITSTGDILTSELPLNYPIIPVQPWHQVCKIKCSRVANMVALTHLDIDAVIGHMTEKLFGRRCTEQEFDEWTWKLQLKEKVIGAEITLRRNIFSAWLLLAPFKAVVNTLETIMKAMFSSYMIRDELFMWLDGSSDPGFVQGKAVILHASK